LRICDAAVRTKRRLIVNADGFGFGPGATQGILDALAGGGPITSVSVNANFPEAERVKELVARHPALSVGVHLNPIVGSPCAPPKSVPTLVGENGEFHGKRFYELWRRGQVSLGDLEHEFDAQIRSVQSFLGDRPTHLDAQEHSHLLYFDLFLRMAAKWNIPCLRTNASLIGLESPRPRSARLRAYLRRPHVYWGHAYRRFQMSRARRRGFRMAERLVTVGYAGTGNKTVLANWVHVLRNLPAGTFEIYCHPGYPDAVIRRWSTTYAEPRLAELGILRTPELRDVATQENVELISFRELGTMESGRATRDPEVG
jgi:predicted glycoside hydrolase/deacetylase ChbG (UPF0249 family)